MTKLLLICVLVTMPCASGLLHGADLVPMTRTGIFPEDKASKLIDAVSSGTRAYRMPDGFTEYWTPTEKDLQGIEDGLPAFLLDQKRKRSDYDWKNYIRQVAGVRRGKDRFIFVSYYWMDPRFIDDKRFKPPMPLIDWLRTNPLWMGDGGSTYFRVLYDLQKKKFVWYVSNGIA